MPRMRDIQDRNPQRATDDPHRGHATVRASHVRHNGPDCTSDRRRQPLHSRHARPFHKVGRGIRAQGPKGSNGREHHLQTSVNTYADTGAREVSCPIKGPTSTRR